jgi:hypothetical protein
LPIATIVANKKRGRGMGGGLVGSNTIIKSLNLFFKPSRFMIDKRFTRFELSLEQDVT